MLIQYWTGIDSMVCRYQGRDGADHYRDFKEAVRDCLRQCYEFVGEEDYVMFGHSLGAFLAYEVACQMQYIYDNSPCKLFISGEPSPIPGGCSEEFGTDEELKDYLRHLGGTDERILTDEAFIGMIFRRMRGDFHLINTYHPKPKAWKLNTDMVWLYGREDKDFREDNLDLWSRSVTGDFHKKIFDGGHFYFYDHPEDVAEFIRHNVEMEKMSYDR